MKITDIETYVLGGVALVRVRTDDGAEGIGQTSAFEPETTVKVLHELVAPHFLGQDPWSVDTLVSETIRRIYKFPSTFVNRALCGIDTAIWDLLGQITGQPVHRLLGSTQNNPEVELYASSMRRDLTGVEEAERLVGEIERHGYRGAKIRIGGIMARDADVSPGRTESIIREVREAVGEGVSLRADGNGGFHVSRAIQVGRLLEEHGYFHFEEPCPYTQYEATRQVTDALDIAVAGGEQDVSVEQFNRLIRDRVVDIVQPDVGYLGGIARTRNVAILADVAGVPCTLHSANSTLTRVFSAHLTAAMPACSQQLEWSIERGPWVEDFYEPDFHVTDGVITLSQSPGWGITLAEGVLDETTRRVSRLSEV